MKRHEPRWKQNGPSVPRSVGRRKLGWLSVVWLGVVWLAVTACNRTDRVGPPVVPAATESMPPGAAPDEGALPPFASSPSQRQTPTSLYEGCRARVEGADTEGECQTDADCQRAGCSRELCISASDAAAGPMSTCEVRPCFAVLDACGCRDGVCAWSVRD